MDDSTRGPDGRLRLTLAVELPVVPLSAGLVAVTIAPLDGVTVSFTVFPTGTPAAANSTVTGFEVLCGNVTSALPVGAAGTSAPATRVMRRVGRPGANTVPGA